MAAWNKKRRSSLRSARPVPHEAPTKLLEEIAAIRRAPTIEGVGRLREILAAGDPPLECIEAVLSLLWGDPPTAEEMAAILAEEEAAD